jgi:hypothetical protein
MAASTKEKGMNTGWIEWSGGECPVPDGREIEVRYRNGRKWRGVVGQDDGLDDDAWDNDGVDWDVIFYRDLTAFEQSKERVPPFAYFRADELAGGDYREAFARYIAQHEQPPRDRLREIADLMWGYCSGDSRRVCVDRMTGVLRANLPAAAIKAIEEMYDD